MSGEGIDPAALDVCPSCEAAFDRARSYPPRSSISVNTLHLTDVCFWPMSERTWVFFHAGPDDFEQEHEQEAEADG